MRALRDPQPVFLTAVAPLTTMRTTPRCGPPVLMAAK